MAPGAKEGESSFSIPNGAAIFRREPPNGGVKCRWGIGTNRDMQISNLSVVSKLLERLFSSQLVKYLKDNDLLQIFSRRIEQCTRRKRLFSHYRCVN